MHTKPQTTKGQGKPELPEEATPEYWRKREIRAQAQHSPLPWHIAEYGISELKAKYLCIKHGNKTIARIDAPGNSLSVTKTDEANAKLIVASVNNAEKLAEALRLARQDVFHCVPDPVASAHLKTIDAALAQWEESQAFTIPDALVH